MSKSCPLFFFVFVKVLMANILLETWFIKLLSNPISTDSAIFVGTYIYIHALGVNEIPSKS